MKRSPIGEGYSSGASTQELPVGSQPELIGESVSAQNAAESLDAMGPERHTEDEDALRRLGSGVVAGSGVVEAPEAYSVHVADQVEAAVNNPASEATDFVAKQGQDKNGKTTRSTYAVMADGSQKRVSANDMLVERGYDPGAYKVHKAEVKATKVAGEAAVTDVPEATGPFEAAKERDKTRAAESVDAILKESKGINLVERVKLARAEKRWRADVRAVNKPGINQEIRDAKARVRVAKDTYGFRGRQVLRKQERNALKTEIDQRRAEGKLNFVQSRLTKIKTYGVAKREVQEQSKGKIEQAEGIVDSARANKRLFLERNGRRSNTLRKNYGRVKARTAKEGYYSGSGYLSGDRQPLATLYNSEENEKKRQAARAEAEKQQKARAEAAKRRSAKRK